MKRTAVVMAIIAVDMLRWGMEGNSDAQAVDSLNVYFKEVAVQLF